MELFGFNFALDVKNKRTRALEARALCTNPNQP